MYAHIFFGIITIFVPIVFLKSKFDMKKIHQKLILSIDIGGTYIKLGLVHPERGILGKARIRTATVKGKSGFIKALSEKIDELKHTTNLDYELEGIGIGAPGVSSEEGVIAQAANVSFLANVNLIKLLEREFHIPAALAKDSSLAAIGEGEFGAAKGMKNYIVLTIGTGLGCAVVVNGEILKGASGLAGEFGHTLIRENGRACGCGRKGCLETYVSGKGIVRTVFELLANSNKKSSLRDFSYNEITPKIIFQEAQKNDPIAKKAFWDTGKIIGERIANLFTIFDPEAVILAGGLIEAADFLMPAIVETVEKNTLYFLKDKTNVLLSALGANDAALFGAASLILKRKKEILI